MNAASKDQAERAARAARLAQRPGKGTPEAETLAPAARPVAAPRVKPVRLSLDLAPQSYRTLKTTCDDLADELGQARVTTSEVLRVLVGLLDQDPAVRRAVSAALEGER